MRSSRSHRFVGINLLAAESVKHSTASPACNRSSTSLAASYCFLTICCWFVRSIAVSLCCWSLRESVEACCQVQDRDQQDMSRAAIIRWMSNGHTGDVYAGNVQSLHCDCGMHTVPYGGADARDTTIHTDCTQAADPSLSGVWRWIGTCLVEDSS